LTSIRAFKTGEIMDENQGLTLERAEHGWADVAIRLALVALVVYWSFLLLRPFIAILIWAAILSVALYPIYLWLKRVLGGRSTVASFLLTVLVLVVILGPISAIGAALARNLSSIAVGISEGTVTVPPPPPYVAEWPLVGGKLSAFWQTASISEGTVTVPPPPPYVAEWPLVGGKLSAFWQTASAELEQTLASIEPQLKETARKLLGVAGNIGIGVLQFTVAIIIAGFTYSRAAGIQEFLKNLAARAAPRMGEGFVDLAGRTVRSVARGVVGISLIQSILFGIGALVADIPLAGLWTFVALILSIIQVGPGLVILPIIIFAWSSMDTVSAAILTAYMVPVMLLDNVLKPIVMGRGLPVPMLVIFIGVIGGTMVHGLIGLFVGPIVLSLGYELGRAWILMGRASSES
jgi:predicted PurR-regulated permease PerM